MDNAKKHKRIRFTDEQKLKMLSKTKGKCAHCGMRLTLQTMTVEHLYPIDKGGDNTEYNTVALCEKCNHEKSNWVYDMSYYIYILDNEYDKYNYYLNKMIYENSDSSAIFGKCNREVFAVEAFYHDKFNKKFDDRNIKGRKIVRCIGKRIEIRQLLPGDIDNDAKKLIIDSYEAYDIDGNPYNDIDKKLNEYFLQNMFDTSTWYGAYHKDKILGILTFTNIKSLKLYNESFMDEINKLGYKDTYVLTLVAYVKGYDALVDAVNKMIWNYMLFNNSLVLNPDIGFASALRYKSKKIPATIYALEDNNDFIIIEGIKDNHRVEVLALDDYFDATVKAVDELRHKYDKIKERISNE